jgi:trk system potassium uptake protein TrkH
MPFDYEKIKLFFTPPRLLVFSFGIIIMTGTLLLQLPQATLGKELSFLDALFTATSATCVTGLIVVDTGTTFTHFGQVVILLMIQLGGLGLMTFSTFFISILGKRLTLHNRSIVQDSFSHKPIRNIKDLLLVILISTFVIEFAGVILLTARFVETMPFSKALYYAVFHSISAFCNAGFSLFPDSLVSYQDDVLVNITISGLIILGGLGFIVIYEISQARTIHIRKLSLHAKVVLYTSGLLIAIGAILFFVLEYDNTLHNLSWKSKILTSFFQSITTRTAGFNSLDIGVLSNPTLFVLILLMVVGASPGSCGGGVKTTTLAIYFAIIKARLKNQTDVNIFNRGIPSHIVSKTIAITFFTLTLICIGLFLLLSTELAEVSHIESRGMFLELLFEVVSAFATVGLSMGVTAGLTSLGKTILIALMFIGRIGPLTMAIAIGEKDKINLKMVKENVMVG